MKEEFMVICGGDKFLFHGKIVPNIQEPNLKWCFKCPDCHTWINWQNKPIEKDLCPQCRVQLPNWINIGRFKVKNGY